MPQFEFADYGVIGFFMLIILVTVWKLPEIIKSAKSSPKTQTPKVEDKSDKTDKEEHILEGLTTAITKLTVFLETDAAVNKEKEKVLYGNISDIRLAMIKLQENDTEMIRLIKEHSLRCDMSCINKKGE